MKTERINLLVTEDEKKSIQDKQMKYGFVSLSEYIRFMSINGHIKVVASK